MWNYRNPLKECGSCRPFVKKKRLTDEFEQCGTFWTMPTVCGYQFPLFEASYDPVTGSGLCSYSNLFRPKLAVLWLYSRSYLCLYQYIASFSAHDWCHSKFCNLADLNHFCRPCLWDDGSGTTMSPSKLVAWKTIEEIFVWPYLSYDGKQDVLKNLLWGQKRTNHRFCWTWF